MKNANLMPLLDFIAEHESRGDWDIVWGGIKPNHKPPKPLTQMTIGEVLDWQDRIDPHYMSEAAGRYQILEDTLRGLYKSVGLTRSDKFNRQNQNLLAVGLLKRRGLDDYLAGSIGTAKFANSLAKEWASLPVVSGPKAGRSYYDGDGLNKALVDVKPFIAAVEAIQDMDPKPQPGGPIALIIGAILAAFAILAGVFE